MSNDIQKFNLTAHIREKVRETLVMAIPDEQMDAMIRTEFDEYFKERNEYGREKPSRLSLLVREELDKLMREKIKKWLNENFERRWEGNIDRHVGELVGSLAPIVQHSIVVDITQRALSDLANRL